MVGVMTWELHLDGCRSLKEKRHVVKTLTASLRARFNVSVAEVDHHDLWQRTAIAVAVTGAQGYHVKKVMHEVRRLIERSSEVEMIDADLSLYYPEG